MIKPVISQNINSSGNLKEPLTKLAKENSVIAASDSISLSSSKDIKEQADAKKLADLKNSVSVADQETGEESKSTLKTKIIGAAGKIAGVLDDLDNAIDAFPGFIYPSVGGGTKEQIEFTYSILDKMPLKDVSAASHVQWLDKLTLLYDTTKEASGMAIPFPGAQIVGLSKNCVGDLSSFSESTIIHEFGHMRDYSEGFASLLRMESAKGDLWGKGPHISEYAKNNRLEDFAESFEEFYKNPERLKAECPEKYEKIAELEKMGLFDKIVERDAFRETGKFIGKTFSKIPLLKPALSTLSYGLQVRNLVKGAKELSKGIDTGDERKQMEGSLKFMANACYASKLFAVGGIAIEGASKALSEAIDKKEITAEQANYVASHSAGAPAQGLIRLGKWINKKFHKTKMADKPKTEQTETETKAGENNTEKKKVTLKGAKKAIAIAAGGAAGSVSGSMLGLYAGVTAGFAVAGPIGGAIGLVVGTVIGNIAMTKAGAKIGTAIGNLITKNDNKPTELTSEEREKDPRLR